jgi:hypothetical protein
LSFGTLHPLIKSSPQKIIAEGTAWRFPNERKKEGKGEKGQDEDEATNLLVARRMSPAVAFCKNRPA